MNTRTRKKHFFVSAFFNEAYLRYTKNEAGLCPMKRAFGSQNDKYTSLHTNTASDS